MSADDRDPPIQPLEYLMGMKVIDIGDIRVARGQSRRPASSCRHARMVYDSHERRVWCQDCERDIEGFDAFVLVAERFHEKQTSLERLAEKVKEAEAHALISLAAKEVDRLWRKHSMVPTCPVCSSGLFPEDFKNGVRLSVGRDYGAASREKSGKPVPGYKPTISGVPRT